MSFAGTVTKSTPVTMEVEVVMAASSSLPLAGCDQPHGSYGSEDAEAVG
jgi:hypothetical protein